MRQSFSPFGRIRSPETRHATRRVRTRRTIFDQFSRRRAPPVALGHVSELSFASTFSRGTSAVLTRTGVSKFPPIPPSVNGMRDQWNLVTVVPRKFASLDFRRARRNVRRRRRRWRHRIPQTRTYRGVFSHVLGSSNQIRFQRTVSGPREVDPGAPHPTRSSNSVKSSYALLLH